MTLTFNESNALSTLETVISVIKEVDELRTNNDRLVAQHIQDTDAIAILSDTKESLEARIAQLEGALAVVQHRNLALADERAALEASLRQEQELAGRHWNDLSNTRLVLCDIEYNLQTVTFDRNRTAAKLTEAEEKLGKFRDILGIPHPVESVTSPEPSPEPVVEVDSPADSEAVTSDDYVVINWDSLKAQPEEAESVEDYPYRDAL